MAWWIDGGWLRLKRRNREIEYVNSIFVWKNAWGMGWD